MEKKKRKSARSVQYWIDKGYNLEDAKFEAKKRMPGSFEYFKYFKGISDDLKALEAVKEYKDQRAVTLNNMIRRYGDVIGNQKWQSYINKQAETNTFEYKQKKYGWTKEQFDEYNQSRAVTLKNMVKRYGEDDGKKKWQEYCEVQRTAGISLEYFIETYGSEAGTIKYNRMLKMKSRSYESYLEKYNGDVDKAIEAYQRAHILSRTTSANAQRSKSSSKIAIELFDAIVERIDLNNHRIFYYPFNQEWAFFKSDHSVIYVDFFDKKSGKVIEFFGDFWHGNPNIYKEDEFLNLPGGNRILVQEQWEKDRARIEYIKQFPYINDVLIVWEEEYRHNKENIINKCIQYLTT